MCLIFSKVCGVTGIRGTTTIYDQPLWMGEDIDSIKSKIRL